MKPTDRLKFWIVRCPTCREDIQMHGPWEILKCDDAFPWNGWEKAPPPLLEDKSRVAVRGNTNG